MDIFFFEWAKFCLKKKEQNQKFLNKSPKSNGEVRGQIFR